MGRLNGDGTATLPDGSTVKVITRGITGTYVRLFNMGNGTWLADVPSSGHVQADGGESILAYSAVVAVEQVSDVSTYVNQVEDTITGETGSLYYFNIIGATSIKVKDAINNTEYIVDPQLYESIRIMESPLLYWLFYSAGDGVSNLRTWNGPYLYYTAARWNTTNVPNFLTTKMRYCYSGPEVMFSPTCRDLLIYQISNQHIFSNFKVANQTNTFSTEDVVDVGSLSINYTLLQDFFFEDGFLRCTNIRSGTYTPPPISTVSTPFEPYVVGNNETTGTTGEIYGDFLPFLYRNEQNEADFDLKVSAIYNSVTYISIPVPPERFEVQRSFTTGNSQFLVNGVCSSRSIIWRNEDSTRQYLNISTSAMKFKNEYRGIQIEYDNFVGQNYSFFLASRETFGPSDFLVSGQAFINSNAQFLVSTTRVYNRQDIYDALYNLDPSLVNNVSFALISPTWSWNSAVGIGIATLFSDSFSMNRGFYSALNYSDNLWLGRVMSDRPGYYLNVKLSEGVDGLQASYVTGKNKYISSNNFIFSGSGTSSDIYIEDGYILRNEAVPTSLVMNKPNS